MATIVLYKDKLNGVGGLINNIVTSSNNLNSQLGALKTTLQGVNSSTCNLQETVNNISSSTKTEGEKSAFYYRKIQVQQSARLCDIRSRWCYWRYFDVANRRCCWCFIICQ